MELHAFGQLVEAHYAAVHAVAYATTRDIALAEDVAQDTFVAAWTSLDRLRDPARVRPWLCGIARNQARNALRRRGREVEQEDVMDAHTPLDAVVDRETSRSLADALAAIPARYREALVLFYWEEQSIAQVATMLAISEAAAQKRISRAREFLEQSLVAQLDTSGRTRKRASAAAAAAVLALITTRGVAKAAPAAKGSAMSTWLARSLLLASGALVFAVGLSHGGHSSSSPAAAPTATTLTNTARTAAHEPALPPPASASHVANGPGEPAARRTFGTPSAYELTVLAPTSVAVELAGGKSATFLWQQPDAPAIERHVRGRVVDAQNHGVAGAVVVVANKITAHWGSLMANEGAVSGPDGTFDILAHRDNTSIALALHGRGWSAPISVPDGRADATITIVLPAPGTLAMHTRQAGAPREAELFVSQPNFELALETDAHGDFELAQLAPGRYHVRAHSLQQFAGGSAPATEQDVTVTAGHTADVQLELRNGTLVVVTPKHSQPLMTIEYFLSPGTERLPLDELTRRARGGQVMDTLFGGQDLDNAMQFHDVTPGAHTLCVDARITREQHLPLDCRTIDVPADKPVLELDVALP